MKDKLTRGLLWLSGAKLLVNLLSLASTFVLARLLTPADFGVVALATTMQAILAAVTELSLSQALIHHRDPQERHFHTAWTLNALRALLVAGLFAASAPLAVRFFDEPRLDGVMLGLALSILLSGLNNPKTVQLTRELQFWQEFVLTVAQKLAGFVVGVALALVYKSYWALIGGMLVAQATGVVVSYAIRPFMPRPSLSGARELWSFSVWLTLGQIVNTLNWKLDHLLIGRLLSTSALGVYTVGDKLAGMPTQETTGPIQQALFPGLRTVADAPERLRRAYQRAQALISFVALPAGFACAALSPLLVQLVLGDKWADAVPVVQVLACVFALQTMSSPVQPLAMAKGATRLLFRRDLQGFAIRVPLILVGVWLGGFMGIVYARMCSGLISIAINMHLVRALIGVGMRDQLLNTRRSLISVGVMYALLQGLVWACPEAMGPLVRVATLVGLLVAGLAAYLLVHFGLWELEHQPAPGPEAEVMAALRKMAGRVRALRI